MDDKIVNRLLIEFEQLLRTTNAEHIAPVIEELSLDSLKPVVELVARSRASYVKTLYELCQKYEGSDEFPTSEEMERLSLSRNRYIDLTNGAQSIEISIQRGYLDIKEP